ncbi:MAG TPA: hypothetical protein VGO93_02930, partial [Candidatus Xenobia bacterium]
ALGLVGYFYDASLDVQCARMKDEVQHWDDKISLIKGDIRRIIAIQDDNTRLRAENEQLKKDIEALKKAR